MVSDNSVSKVAHVSVDFGETWNAKTFTANNSGTFYFTCSVSSTGKYMFCGGFNATIMISNDFGNTFAISFGSTTAIANVINPSGISMITNESGSIFRQDCNGSPFNINTFTTIPSGSSNSSGISSSPDGVSFVNVGTGGFTHSTGFNSGTIITRATPVVFTGVVHCGGIIYASSSTSVWSTTDLGVTWKLFYTGSPRAIASSYSDGSIIYILNTDGEVVFKRSSGVEESRGKLIYAIGSTLGSFRGSVAFVNTLTTITGASLLNIPPGVWAISFSWGFSASSIDGDGTKKVTYGLSTTSTGFEIMKKNKRYTIKFGDTTTWESYAECIIVNLKTTTSLFLNAFINNASATTGAIMKNGTIKASLIGTLFSSIL
jgi:hypothetical protein